MTAYLLDTSVQQRLDRSPEVRSAVERLFGRGDLIASSDVTILESGFSATSARLHAQIVDLLTGSYLRLPLTEDVGTTAIELQSTLFAAGVGRDVGVIDLLHAATAIVHGAVVMHYDEDYERLAEVDGRLRHQWVVPRGSID